MATPHDTLFCRVFSDPHHAAGELRAMLPERTVRRIAWDSLTNVSGDFKDEAHGNRYADLVFGVRLDGRRALLHLVFEHKSWSEWDTALSVLVYAVRLLDRFRCQHRKARRIPAVITLVVHHSATGWRHATDVVELVDLDAAARDELAAWLPGLRFLLHDLSRSTPEELAEANTAIAALALCALQQLREPDADLADVLRRLRWLFDAALAAPDTGDLLGAVLDYIGKVRDLPRLELQNLVRAELGPEPERAMASTYEQTLDEGRAEGRVSLLLQLLAERFGELPSTVTARVHRADAAQVSAWALRVLDAETLEDVFAED